MSGRALAGLSFVLVVVVAGGLSLVLADRGDDGGNQGNPSAKAKTAKKTGGQNDSGAAADPAEPDISSELAPETKTLPESTCPVDLDNCVVASGRVIYVEKVDPDGDGDAHFVTASTDSVTGPGITIFDVRTDLRPDPLPGIGDLIGGAGPVYRGHAGQKQIEVIEFAVAR
ncbi:MAG: hypothetical protein WBW62_05115 [Solirubrobacterales bacterium]